MSVGFDLGDAESQKNVVVGEGEAADSKVLVGGWIVDERRQETK